MLPPPTHSPILPTPKKILGRPLPSFLFFSPPSSRNPREITRKPRIPPTRDSYSKTLPRVSAPHPSRPSLPALSPHITTTRCASPPTTSTPPFGDRRRTKQQQPAAADTALSGPRRFLLSCPSDETAPSDHSRTSRLTTIFPPRLLCPVPNKTRQGLCIETRLHPIFLGPLLSTPPLGPLSQLRRQPRRRRRPHIVPPVYLFEHTRLQVPLPSLSQQTTRATLNKSRDRFTVSTHIHTRTHATTYPHHPSLIAPPLSLL